MEERKLHPAGPLDVPVPPGETLKELLVERGIDAKQFMLDARFNPEYFWELLNGEAAIVVSVAERLERELGTPARLWLSLEEDYQEARARVA